MKFTALGSVAVLLSLEQCLATTAHHHAHEHYRRDHSRLHASRAEQGKVAPRSDGQCAFPTDDPNLVKVPGQDNGGWAMAPDKSCKPGHYCPFACKPGMLMNQWKPNTTYTYPESTYGGLYCNEDGEIEQPFPGEPNCVDGLGSVEVTNECGDELSFCQTVCPGDEDMLIPTVVSGSATLAVPDTGYWDGTAAHFYINGPGIGSDGCIWGESGTPVGNWVPFVAGANADSEGKTFVKLGWNPVYFEEAPLKNTLPDYGVKIKCDEDANCNGRCSIDPSETGLNEVDSDFAEKSDGAAWCQVVVPKGKKATIVVFSTDGSGGYDSDEPPASSAAPSSTAEPEEPTTTSHKPEPTTTSVAPTTTSTSSTSAKETTTTSATIISSSVSVEEYSTASIKRVIPTLKAHIFHENATSTTSRISSAASRTASALLTASTDEPGTATSAPSPSDTKSEGINTDRGSAAFVGLIVAMVAAACMY